jgi:hypothetical protein
MRNSLDAVVLLAVIALAPASARADADTDRAHQLAEDGARALELKHFQTALDCFHRAEMLAATPSYALGLARAQAGLNRVVAARQTYAAIVSEGVGMDAPSSESRAVADAKRELYEVSSRVSTVVIIVTGPTSPFVTIDDTPVPVDVLTTKRLTDPGSHVVRATALGFQPAEIRFTVTEGGEATASLAMAASADQEPTPTPLSSSLAAAPIGSHSLLKGEAAVGDATHPSNAGALRTSAYFSFGLGGAALLFGIVEGLRAASIRSDLQNTCAPNCSQDDVGRARTAIDMSTAGYIIGAGGLLAGITLLVIAPHNELSSARPRPNGEGIRVEPSLGIGSLGATGSF